MEWYIQLPIYIVCVTAAFFLMWQVDFNRFMRIGRKEFSILVYIAFSLAVGFLIGRLLIEIGTLLINAQGKTQ